ncbi:MAG: hypothetical protein ACPLTR_09300, partial [Thermacetogeniaceae bacterium]
EGQRMWAFEARLLGAMYPHHFPGSFIHQQYLPDTLKGIRYYEPSESGFEKEIKLRLERLWGSPKKEE